MGGKRDEVARWMRGRDVLIPFLRQEDLPVASECARSFAFDNSAYTAWKQGITVNWSSYMDWVEAYARHPGFAWAIIPDVIDGSERDNDAMISKWYGRFVPPHVMGVPVWHLHERTERLQYLASRHHMVALGSSGEYSTVGTYSWWKRMNEAMDAVCDADGNPMCKLHGLRMLDPEIFTVLPLASADSTSVARNSALTSRFGTYCPPTLCQRMASIADRIEIHNSAGCWKRRAKQLVLTEISDSD